MADVVTDDGVRLHVKDHGNAGTPLICLHGMGGAASDFDEIARTLERQDVRVIALDSRGHGRSHAEPCALTSERLARDILLVADALGVPRFAVLGHSFGGKVALTLAAMAPDRITGLLLVAAVGPGPVPLERDAVEEFIARKADRAFLRETFSPWFKPGHDAARERWIDSCSRTPQWALRAVCEVALWTDLTGTVGRIAAPAVVFEGSYDPVYGPAYQTSSVLPSLRRVRRETLDCGHALVLEAPAEVARHTAAFVRQFVR